MSYQTQSILLVKKQFDTEPLNQITQKFVSPISLPRKTKIALNSINIYYSWRSILASLGNNTLNYIFNGISYPVVFPDGFYSIEDINGYLHFVMKTNGHYLVDNNGDEVYYISIQENQTYYSFTFTFDVFPIVLPVGWSDVSGILNVPPLVAETFQIVIPATPIRDILGMNAQTFPLAPALVRTQKNSDYVPQITNTTSINIHCPMVSNSNFNPSNSDVLYTFSPNVAYGSFISIEPSNLVFLPCHTSWFPELKLTLTDQNNKLLDVQDFNWNATILLQFPE